MRKIFVHRYKWSHEKRRKQLRKAAKEGEIKLLEKLYDGFLYEVPDDFKLAKRG